MHARAWVRVWERIPVWTIGKLRLCHVNKHEDQPKVGDQFPGRHAARASVDWEGLLTRCRG